MLATCLVQTCLGRFFTSRDAVVLSPQLNTCMSRQESTQSKPRDPFARFFFSGLVMEYDELLTEQDILKQQFRPGTSQIKSASEGRRCPVHLSLAAALGFEPAESAGKEGGAGYPDGFFGQDRGDW